MPLTSHWNFSQLGAFDVLDTIPSPKIVAAGPTARAVSIVGVVNAARALAKGTLLGSVFWYDNNKAAGSQFLGTDHLVSAIDAGAAVTWVVSPLEVETFVEFVGMTGPAAKMTNATLETAYDGGLVYWKGQVASSAKGEYSYTFSLNVGGRVMELPADLTLAVANEGGR